MNTNKKLLYALLCAVTLQAAVPVHASMWTNVTTWWNAVPEQSKRTVGIVAAGFLAAFGLYTLWNRSKSKTKKINKVSTIVPTPTPVVNPLPVEHDLIEHNELDNKIFKRRHVEIAPVSAQPILEVHPVVVVQPEKEIAQPVSVVAEVAAPVVASEPVAAAKPDMQPSAYTALRADIDEANFEKMLKDIFKDIDDDNLSAAGNAIEAMDTIVQSVVKRIEGLHALCSVERKMGIKTSITEGEYKILIDGIEGVRHELTCAKGIYQKEVSQFEEPVVEKPSHTTTFISIFEKSLAKVTKEFDRIDTDIKEKEFKNAQKRIENFDATLSPSDFEQYSGLIRGLLTKDARGNYLTPVTQDEASTLKNLLEAMPNKLELLDVYNKQVQEGLKAAKGARVNNKKKRQEAKKRQKEQVHKQAS